jgi:hypothetical protein
MIGFATRDVTDKIIKKFVDRAGGKFHNKLAQVGPMKKTHWPTFDREEWLQEKTPAVIFGCLRGTEQIIWDCNEYDIPYYYFDHAYVFKAIQHRPNVHIRKSYYRITKNKESVTKLIKWRNVREIKRRVESIKWIKDFDIDVTHYKNGTDILILPPTESICRLYNYGSPDEWINKTKNELIKHTDRNIIVKRKDDQSVSLDSLFKKSYCIVSSQTTAVIDAIKRGIPSFCEDISCAVPVSKTNLSEIENPYRPSNVEVEDWFGSLLCNQFSTLEIKNGEAKNLIDSLQ